jgi:hypothetical protein
MSPRSDKPEARGAPSVAGSRKGKGDGRSPEEDDETMRPVARRGFPSLLGVRLDAGKHQLPGLRHIF